MKKTTPETPETISPEIQQIIQQAAGILKAAGAEAVYLFGSTAERKNYTESDIDLAVSGLPPAKYFQTLGQIMTVSSQSIDLVDLDTASPFTIYLKQKNKLHRVA